MISNSSISQIQIRHYQRLSIVMVAVILGHLLVFLCMLKMVQPYTFATPPVIQAIRVHFVSLTKTQPLPPQQAQTSTQTVSEQPTPKTRQQEIIHSLQSSKIVEKQPSTDRQPVLPESVPTQKPVTEQVTRKEIQQPPAQVISMPVESESQTVTAQQQQSQAETNQTQTNQQQQTQANEQQQGQTQAEQLNRAGQNQQTSKAHDQPIVEQQPLRVSNIDVLSIGAIKYDERILQNQERILILTITVDPQGLPDKISIKQSSGIAALDQIVIKAAQKSRFKPYKVDGKAMSIIVDYPFQLKPNQRR